MISVIIPVYNRSEELQRAIKSVLNQTVKDWELLVIDDCSETDIRSVVNAFKDERIRYYRIEKKGNANVCRNLGIKNVKGEYIAMLDSDDEWLPEHLAKSRHILLELNADGIFSSYRIFDGEKLSSSMVRPFLEGEQMVNYVLDGNAAATPTHFYKTECVRQVLWDENLERHQDYDFVVRFADKYSFVPVQLLTVIVHWRKNEKRSVHLPSQVLFLEKHKSKLNKKLFIKYNRETYASILNKEGVDPAIKKYFKQNIFDNIKDLSLTDYMSIYAGENRAANRIIGRLIFVIKILFS